MAVGRTFKKKIVAKKKIVSIQPFVDPFWGLDWKEYGTVLQRFSITTWEYDKWDGMNCSRGFTVCTVQSKIGKV